MATAPKKATTKKAAPAKKSAAKAKSKATNAKKAAPAVMQSFRPVRPSEPFFTFRVTRQTVYWLILSVIIVALGAWVLQLNARVQAIYDQIDQNNLTFQDLQVQKIPAKKTTESTK